MSGRTTKPNAQAFQQSRRKKPALCRPARVEETKPSCVGIEFGAMHSRVAIVTAEEINVLPTLQTSKFSPSYIAFTENGTLFGEAARIYSKVDPNNTVFGVRNLIGRKFSEIESEIKHLPFKVVSKDNQPVVEINVAGSRRYFTPDDLYGFILKTIKDTVEGHTGTKVSQAVVTVPQSFDDNQMDATKHAAGLAGLDVLRLLREPGAAGISHYSDLDYDEMNYLIYNLEGNMLALHIIQSDQGVMETLATLNYTITDEKSEFSASYRYDMGNLDAFTPSVDGLFQTSLSLVERALKLSGLEKRNINAIILAGNSGYLPKLQPLLEEYLGVKAADAVEPANVYVMGAALMSRVLISDDGYCTLPIDVCPLSIGIESANGLMKEVIHRHTPVPTRKRNLFTTEKHNQTVAVVKVHQGLRALARENVFLGELKLDLPPLPKGIPVIEVGFELDANYQLTVTAHELKSGRKEKAHMKTIVEGRDRAMIDFLLMKQDNLYAQDDVLRELLPTTNAISGL